MKNMAYDGISRNVDMTRARLLYEDDKCKTFLAPVASPQNVMIDGQRISMQKADWHIMVRVKKDLKLQKRVYRLIGSCVAKALEKSPRAKTSKDR